MKSTLKIRLVAALLCLVMLFAASCAAPNDTTPPTTTPDATDGTDGTTDTTPESELPKNGAKKIVTETKKLYANAQTVETLEVAYYEDTPEILLVSTDVLTNEFFKGLLSSFASYEFEEDEESYIIKRTNGSHCNINFVNDDVMFSDYDRFSAKRSDSMSDFLATSYLDSNGNNIYFQTLSNKDIAGHVVYFNLGDRGIPLDIYEGKKYIPLQTINDLFLLPYGVSYVYNGQDLYFAQAGTIDASLIEQYYSVGPAQRSEALAEFTAIEFCLAMELNYGLQDEHGVDVGFAHYLINAGLWDELTSTDPTTSSLGLVSLAFGFLADKHTGANLPSPYTGSPVLDKSKVEYDSSFLNYVSLSQQIPMIRQQVMPEGTPAYQEIGNTAYVTFDAFTIDPIRFQDYSEASLKAADTFGLIIYAHSQITRENSPIENVVLDLSCNGGGAADAAIYVVSWMLGHCDLSMTNPITDSFSTTRYVADVNLDGVFDSRDTIADKNLYCITSPLSFSCGNLVPALLKDSGRVTMLGGTSGGGACAVNFLTLADGSMFQISSPKHLTVVSNGSYYTIDRGVEPHYYFSKFEGYYDRDAITAFINNLI